ncbi:MAG: hypothetical protein MIO93_02450 [ANME-2 cluster archaeon]|nr:hypothetical protein [ANME-2 cluster archaeon]
MAFLPKTDLSQMEHSCTKITSNTVGCYPASLAVSGCRVSDLNNFINIFTPPPDTR